MRRIGTGCVPNEHDIGVVDYLGYDARERLQASGASRPDPKDEFLANLRRAVMALPKTLASPGQSRSLAGGSSHERGSSIALA